MTAGLRRSNSCKLQQTISERNRNLGLFLKIWLICRIPCHSFTCQWIRKASIVLCLVLESLTTHVNEVDQSGRVFCSYSKDFILRWEEKLIRAIYDELIHYVFSFIQPQEVQYSRPLGKYLSNVPEYEFLFFKKLSSIHASTEMLLTCS